jgi:hypothetical protein
MSLYHKQAEVIEGVGWFSPKCLNIADWASIKLRPNKMDDLFYCMLSEPPAPLPARRAYRPEGRAYASESSLWGVGKNRRMWKLYL